MSTLPENIDDSYSDAGDASIKIHQGHHDVIHQKVNRIPDGTDQVITEDEGDSRYSSQTHDHDGRYTYARAGAKNIFVQPGQPTALQVGDIWIKTPA